MTHISNEEIKTGHTSEDSSAEIDGATDVPLEEQPEGTAPPEDETDTDPEKNELSEIRMLLAEEKDRFVRLYAEFENYKKRAARDALESRKYANEALIKSLLPVMDNLERAIESAPEETAVDGFVEGVRLTRDELLNVLGKFHVKAVESVGQPFNPSFHEAMGQEPSEEAPDGTIMREFQKGYLLHERLIRPAMVVIAKNVTPSPPVVDEEISEGRGSEKSGEEENSQESSPAESASDSPIGSE